MVCESRDGPAAPAPPSPRQASCIKFWMRAGGILVVQQLRLHTPNAGGLRFDPWSGNKDPTCCKAWQKKKKKNESKSSFFSICSKFTELTPVEEA